MNPKIPMAFKSTEHIRHGEVFRILMIVTNDWRSCCLRCHGLVCVDGVADHGLHEVTIIFIIIIIIIIIVFCFVCISLLIHIYIYIYIYILGTMGLRASKGDTANCERRNALLTLARMWDLTRGGCLFYADDLCNYCTAGDQQTYTYYNIICFISVFFFLWLYLFINSYIYCLGTMGVRTSKCGTATGEHRNALLTLARMWNMSRCGCLFHADDLCNY